MEFGTRLTKAREALRKSQTWLGEGLGEKDKNVSKSVVLGWEKGRHFPKVDQLAKICKKLNCGADTLIFGTPTFSAELQHALAKQDKAGLRRIENVIRAHLEMQQLPPDAPALSGKSLHPDSGGQHERAA
jgi:transcriptional regulator with XRE-family HTH domain